MSNGLQLRILRDNVSFTRPAFVEFDLEAMMEGEVYSDFLLLWLLCHQSRVESDIPEQCCLEKWHQTAKKQGTRVLDRLRDGVQKSIEAFGQGFLAHRGNAALRQKLADGKLSTQDYYQQLLRLVYRLIFLFVAEDRDLLLTPDANATIRKRFEKNYSLTRIRRLSQRRRGTRHSDLWQGLKVVFKLLYKGEPCLGLPAHVMDTALDPVAESTAKRCGVIYTSAVEKRTTLLLLRLRYHIITKRKDAEDTQLLAEDCRLLGFRGAPGKAEWITNMDELESLLHAKPSRNIDQPQATGFVQKIIDDFDSLWPHLEEYASQRGDEILESHRRGREATRLTGVKYEIEPQLPVDVLGIYVYLPA